MGDKLVPPRVSVILPTYNAEKIIIPTLSSLVNQKYSHPYEVILVDDGSTDGTTKIIEEFLRSHNDRNKVRLVKTPHRGPAAARNTGVKEAHGDLVLFIDADCVANEKWVSSMIEPLLSDASTAGVGGTYKTLNTNSLMARFVGYDINYRHHRMNEFIDHIGTYSAAFRKKALLEVGLFDESFKQADSEDNDISYRLIDRGHKLAFQPRGWVLHMHPSKVSHFLRKQFWRAYWRALLYAKHQRRMMQPDIYTTWQTQLQPFVWILFGVTALLLSVIRPLWIPLSFLFTLVVLTLLNYGFLKSVYQKERSIKFLMCSLVLCVLRSSVWALGGAFGVLKFGGKFKRK